MSEWMPDANELLDRLIALGTPYCGPKLEAFLQTISVLREWCELGDKAARMEIDERLRLKFYACRRVWKIKGEYAPHALPGTNGKKETWAQWFERMFGQSIEEFAIEAKEKDYYERVRCYEIAKFGMSPLPERKREAA